jgi:hypothetical protein
MFVVIVLGTAAVQAIIVEFGGEWVQTAPLDVVQWLSCIGSVVTI